MQYYNWLCDRGDSSGIEKKTADRGPNNRDRDDDELARLNDPEAPPVIYKAPRERPIGESSPRKGIKRPTRDPYYYVVAAEGNEVRNFTRPSSSAEGHHTRRRRYRGLLRERAFYGVQLQVTLD